MKRFLNNQDYLSIVTEEALTQLIRGNEKRLSQAEEAAEESIIEYLTENYEIEKILAIGKNLEEYNRQVSYPVGSHFYYQGDIYQTMRVINGVKSPTNIQYWSELLDAVPDNKEVSTYSQRINYTPGEIVMFAGTLYICIEYNGPDYNQIRVPGIKAWDIVEYQIWEPNNVYAPWDVVQYDGDFYTLVNRLPLETDKETGDVFDPMDWNTNPLDNDCWGQIGEYNPELNNYQLSATEYVVMDGNVYVPIMNPNADELKVGYNIKIHDPRHPNVKKHLLRLAIYELHKLISPNNVSSARITDYETSILWLRDASRLKLNPGIPRKIDEENKPVADFAIATYMRDYDPYKNPWHI